MTEQEAAPAYITYQQWGTAFFDRAVTEERILGAVNNLAGQPINVGPIGVGPGKIAQVTAKGSIGEAAGAPVPGESISYRVVLPVELSFKVDLQVDSHRYDARLEIPLILTARAASPLKIVIDVVPPLPNQVGITLKSDGLRASMLNRVVGIEGELQRFVAKYVKREVNNPKIATARVIDVAAAIDSAWRSLGPSEEKRTARTVAADLEVAIEDEIRENESRFDGGLAQATEQ